MTMRKFSATVLLLVWCICALAVQKSATIVYINGSKYYIHTVQPGETLYALSKEYRVGESVIREHNPAVVTEGLKAGENVKIPFAAEVTEQPSNKRVRKLFETHTVSKGETLYGISRKYEIPVATLVTDNPNIDPIHLSLGQRILVRKGGMGSETEAEIKAGWEEYRNTLNSVAEAGSAYHLVQPGETFYSLSRRFEITEEALSALNNGLKPVDLRAGAILKVPGSGAESLDAVQPAADTLKAGSELFAEQKVPVIEFKALRRGETLDVALLLPLAADGGEANNNYLEFYQGFLLALDSVKCVDGLSVNVGLYNTGRNAEKIREITESAEFRNAELIVGPVYEEGLDPVVRLAEERQIPVISPLANLTRVNSGAVFQLAPDPAQKYAKTADLLGGGKQVTLIYSGSADKEFEQEILAALGSTKHKKHTYKYVHPSASGGAGGPSDLTPLLDNSDDNVLVVMADNEIDVDRILAALASAETNLTARGHTPPRFTVLGNARWNRYNNVDRTTFFKDRVVFISTYHAKRDSPLITAFDSAYIRAFGSLPTLYSYRGYDAAAIFIPAMFGDIEHKMEGRSYTPLQTTYVFGQGADGGNHVNGNWMRVNYQPDFTITIE